MSDFADIKQWDDARLAENDDDGEELADAKWAERKRRRAAKKEEERKRAEEAEARRKAEEEKAAHRLRAEREMERAAEMLAKEKVRGYQK